MSEELRPYSDAAYEKQRRVAEKEARGEKVTWTDMVGIFQPNPDLPDCQSWASGYDNKCQLGKGHDGPHRHVIEWV